jgi:hypothetical protein
MDRARDEGRSSLTEAWVNADVRQVTPSYAAANVYVLGPKEAWEDMIHIDFRVWDVATGERGLSFVPRFGVWKGDCRSIRVL